MHNAYVFNAYCELYMDGQWSCHSLITPSEPNDIGSAMLSLNIYLPMPWVWLWQRWLSKLNWSFHMSCLLFIEPLDSNIESMWRSKRNKFKFIENWPHFWNVKCSLSMKLHYIDTNEIEPLNANSCNNDFMQMDKQMDSHNIDPHWTL